MTRRLVAVVVITLVGWLGLALPASAHPLGNFSVNVYNGVTVAPEKVLIEHVIDMAEVPTVQAMPLLDVDGDESVSDAELAAFAKERCGAASKRLQLSVGGAAVPLSVDSASAALADGQAGLSTLRIDCAVVGTISLGGRSDVSFSDDSVASDAGWHEVTLRGDGVTVTDADVPAESVSHALTAYPQSQQESPLRVTTAAAQVTPGGHALVDVERATTVAGGDGATDSGVWGWGAAALSTATSAASGATGMAAALLVATVVGAMHALAPGHGKSLVAFALAGRQQRAGRAALTVGTTVTVTHTASVLALGLVVAGTSAVVPSSIYSLLGAVTGVVVVVLGLVLLRGSLRGDGHSHGHSHSHGPGHSHDHGGHSHGHSHDELVRPHPGAAKAGSVVAVLEHRPGGGRGTAESTWEPDPKRRRGVLVTLGIAGGLLPSPSAVVVLLAAAAAGRAWFGVLLVLAFGTGMALTLAGVGFAVLRGQEKVLAMAQRSPRPWLAGVLHRLPVVTASGVVAVGLLLLASSLR